MIVKMFDVESDHKDIKEELLSILNEILSSGEYIIGREVKALEDSFASYIGVKYAVGVGSGNDAIKIGGLSLGLKSGDKFITVPNTYIATTMSLSTHGLIPVFCDIEEETYNMDPQKLEDILKKEKDVKLCIPVHLYGHPARMDEIMDVCKRYDVKVLEDACQAHGAKYRNKKVGAIGDISTFSFFPTKNLGCYGDGGIILTDSEDIYTKAMMLRAYGQAEKKHEHIIEGFNSRLDTMQAALLKHKLEHLDHWNNRRRHIAWMYKKELLDTPLKLPEEASWAYHVYHLYVVRSKEREDMRHYLADRDISTLIHYPTPIHLQEAYKHLGYKTGDFPVAESVIDEIVSLPIYPSLTQDEVMYVSKCIRKFYEK